MKASGTMFSHVATLVERAIGVNSKHYKLHPAYQFIAATAVLILALKIVVEIVAEYRNYLPPDFEAAFLIGRESYFYGFYQVAFYLHIIAGPPSILLCLTLVLSGVCQRRFPCAVNLHRRTGKLLWPVVIFILTPSGLVLAPYAMAGLPSAIAFACLSLATLLTAVLAVRYARVHDSNSHRQWASRCAILLLSPLLLRLVGGLLSTIQLEAQFGYQLNDWLSWLVPLSLYEYSLVRWGYNVRPISKRLAPTSE